MTDISPVLLMGEGAEPYFYW